MKRAFLLLLSCAVVAAKAHACTYYATYVRITVDWADGTSTSHYEFDSWVESGCGGGGGGGGGSVPPIGPGGGGNSARNQYVTLGCDTPDLALFENASAYNEHPAANYTFSQLSGGNTYAILSEELKFGLDQMVNRLDGLIPDVTAAYRTPNQNSALAGSAKCSAHTYGRAADLSIRDPNNGDQFSCTMWNLFVEASDNWVEPWADTVANGGTPHFHIDFTRPGNDPGTCTGYP
jgi:hypothetical protein